MVKDPNFSVVPFRDKIKQNIELFEQRKTELRKILDID